MIFTENNFYNTYFKDIRELPIYYINLDRSKHRRENFEKNLNLVNEVLEKQNNLKLVGHRISAVDGNDKNLFQVIENKAFFIEIT